MLSLAVVLWCAIVFFAAVFSFFLPLRLVLSLFLVLAAVAGHFADGMNIVIDTEIVRSALHSDLREAGDLVGWGLIGRVLLLGVLPALALFAVRLEPAPLMKRQLRIAGAAGAALLLAGVCVLPFGSAYASYAREHKPLRYYSNPTYPIYSAIKLVIDSGAAGVDRSYVTKVASAALPPDDPMRELVVVVVGEAARADHFGINGYARQTTPKLAARDDIVSFSQVTSCGTATATSVPCMFSLDGRGDFDIDSAPFNENVLDVLAKAGVSVLWRDNNTGSQGVADRLRYEHFTDRRTNPKCAHGECRDVGMLSGLDDYIAEQTGDILIVLHQIGSHGPAYYKRYPEKFARFKPDCRTNELSQCSQQEIVNAYDNSIAYTDRFLNAVIRFLASKQAQYETTMLYMSDHGESLGELGVFLHGMPYAIAPAEQRHVPFILWTGQRSDVELGKLREMKDQAFSHDDLSRFLLQLFEVKLDGKGLDVATTRLPMKSEKDAL
jgi:lipid A ethanolaminephosphotransferase